MAMRKHRYTPEQDEWLRQHIEHCNSYRQLTEMFNEHFSVSVGKYSISDRCIKQLHIHRNVNTGTFQRVNSVPRHTESVMREHIADMYG